MRPISTSVLRSLGRTSIIRPVRSLTGTSNRLPGLLCPSTATSPGPVSSFGCPVVARNVTHFTKPRYDPVPGLTPDRARTWEELDYDELKALIEAEDVLLIDVREPEETEMGRIPGSVNIPLGKMIKAFYGFTDEDWLKTYNRVKPQKNDANIVFYGQAMWGMAIKSEAAVKIANRLGYMRARHYIGGFNEWQKKSAQARL